MTKKKEGEKIIRSEKETARLNGKKCGSMAEERRIGKIKEGRKGKILKNEPK